MWDLIGRLLGAGMGVAAKVLDRIDCNLFDGGEES